ncbi:MAG TPA: acyl-CoA reductase [Candidatus Baltobacteraceae bacterium]|nr:acyl-CoA reductase [Candidatus Baltobacteraceae bacterium]
MTALQKIPALRIVRAIASAAERWSDADFPPRVRATDRICERTGYSIPVVDYALDRLFFPIATGELAAAIQGELGPLTILDELTPRDRRPAAWALPVGRVCVIASRTTIGVALVPALFALCAKCDVVVKDREDGLAAAFFASLAEELDEFGAAASAGSWHSGGQEAPALEGFDAVVAFGSDSTLESIARALPYRTAFIGFGSRASAGYVTAEAMRNGGSRSVLTGAARDLVLYESEGCLSLHVLFVERGRGADAAAFAERLADEVELAVVEFPVAERHAELAPRIAAEREAARFRVANGRGAVFSNDRAEYLIVLDPPLEQPPLFLPRALGVIPVDSPEAAIEYLRSHAITIEGFAVAGERAGVVEAAIRAGATRITAFGELQHPPLAGNHGGRPRIAEFVRWFERTE